MNVQEAVNVPRMHHQWLPDEILMEDGISIDTIRLLEGMGYTVRTGAVLGSANSILIDHESGILYGAADPRRHASAAGY
jgi:gamma-glutamyltranspeptidase/glutathione hydrolase